MRNSPTPQEVLARQGTAQIDVLTIAAVGVCAYLLSSITHEALGHGLMSLLLGLHPQHVTSVDLSVNFTHVPDWKRRLVDAAGCGAQVILSVLILGLMRLTPRGAPPTRYFLWLLSTINLIIPGGYLMVLSFVPFGDWSDFVQGLSLPFVWQLLLTLIGVALSLAGLFIGARGLEQFAGRASDTANSRRRRRVTLTFVPYLAGSAAMTLSAIFNPDSPLLILISGAAASFGGTSFLMLICGIHQTPAPDTPEQPLTPTRDWLWVALGVVALIVYFGVLGPGLPR
ncbi:MAG: hypothetical protein ACRDID_13875 [Ktedonobacterales bacterium]